MKNVKFTFILMTTADQKSTHIIIALFGQSIFMNRLWYYTMYVPLIFPKHCNLNKKCHRKCDKTLP